MTRWGALAAVVALVVTGCSDDFVFDDAIGDFPPPPPFDPCNTDGMLPCNVFGAAGDQGCGFGEKCSWAGTFEAESACAARTRCGPDGAVPAGGTCERSFEILPGFTWDDCAAGSVCTDGVCLDICGFEDPGADCAVGERCVAFDGLFTDGAAAPTAGVCDEGCDPVSQRAADGTPCGAGRGCYLFTSSLGTATACVTAGDIEPDSDIAFPRANSCVPGAVARLRSFGTTQMECAGLCRPADVTATTNLESESGVGAESCVTRWGSAPPEDPERGESCRYWWARESFAGTSPYSNSVGWCFDHVDHRYDSDGDGSVDARFPLCRDVTHGDVFPPVGDPPHDDALYFWCVAAPSL